MRVQCPGCETRFRVPDEKIPEAGIRARCSRCDTAFRVRRQESQAAPQKAGAPRSEPPPGPSAPASAPAEPKRAAPAATPSKLTVKFKTPAEATARPEPASALGTSTWPGARLTGFWPRVRYVLIRPFFGVSSRITVVVFASTVLTSLVVTWISVTAIDDFLRGQFRV